MKTLVGMPLILRVAIAALGSIVAGGVMAQTFTTLHTFQGNSDGANPDAGLVLSGNILYGTAQAGGDSGNGTVFALNTDGTGFRNLHSFTATSGPYPSTNIDGRGPSAGLILASNTLYGTAMNGGSSGAGTAFALNTDGAGFTNLHSCTYSEGAGPDRLILSGNTLYGAATAYGGGSSGNGAVFAVNADGTGFTTLYSFTGGSDGANPYGLILSGNTLYGTAEFGGDLGVGTVFAVNTDGTGFRTLYSFSRGDGSLPSAGLILASNTLYGTTRLGGSGHSGTVFAINTDGTGFTSLYTFTALNSNTNSDGYGPYAGLILSGNTLYGTAGGGGSSGNGTVFAVNTDGTGFTNLHSFKSGSDGRNPYAGLILSGNTLYGTAYQGGSSGNGTVFSLSLATAGPPQLRAIPSGANIILTWPTNGAEFTLQSTTNLGSPAVWTTVTPGPVVADGQNAVTNPIVGPQKFYRLRQ